MLPNSSAEMIGENQAEAGAQNSAPLLLYASPFVMGTKGRSILGYS